MIDTLFYFVDTELEYRRLMQGQDGRPGISPTTIVFVGDSREIYVNGKGYGKTSTNGLLASSEFDQWKGQLNERIDNAISGAASANDAARQKAEADLAAAMANIEAALDDTSDDINADILAVRQLIQQAKTELQANIDSANLNADEILSELTTFQGTIRNELETSVRNAITNANGRTIWTELNTTNDGLTAVTNRVDRSLDANGDLKNTQVLQSIIDTGVRNNTAITDIQNKWAVMDENQDVIEWVASGFQSQAHNEGGLAAMFAAAQTDTTNAIAQAKTEVEQDIAGNYVATANLGTSVIGIVEDELQVDSLSALAMKSDVNQATTTITNRLNTLDTTTGNLSTSLSQVESTAEEGKARASLLTDVDGNGTYFVSESKLDSAVNSMLATSGSTSAALIHQMAQADIAAVNIGAQIQNATAGLALQTSVDEVVDNLTGEIQARETAVAGLTAAISGTGGLSESIAAVSAKADANESSITQLSTWKDTTDSWKAGVITQTNKDGAIASLVASNSNSSTKQNLDASIVATVNEDSRVAISADHVFVDSNKQTTIGSSLKDAQDDIDALEGTVAGHTTSISELNTSVSRTSADLSAITAWKNNEEYKSGLVSSSGLDGAVAALFAEGTTTNGTVSSKISTAVNNGISNITLSADKVYIEGQQNVNIKSYFDSELDDAIDGVESDITSLGNTVAGHTTSISEINTKANNTASSLEALSTWKDGFVNSYASGLLTTAGLDGAVADLFAANANTNAKAGVKAVVQGEASSLTLSADQIYLDANRTVANTIEATQGTIGGINISNNSISSSNGNFSLTSAGQLTATGAVLSGQITATSGTIGGFTIDNSNLRHSVSVGDDISSINISSSKTVRKLYLSDSNEWQSSSATSPAITATYASVDTDEYSNSTTLSSHGIITTSKLGTNPTVFTNWIGSDGSGFLGQQGISWDADGDFIVTDKFMAAVMSVMSAGYVVSSNASHGITNRVLLRFGQTGVEAQYDLMNGAQSTETRKVVMAPDKVYSTNSNSGLSTFNLSASHLDFETDGDLLARYSNNYMELVDDNNTYSLIYPGSVMVSDGESNNSVEISPNSIKVTKNGTEKTGISGSFRIKAVGTYLGNDSDYNLTLTFTNGILTGYSTNGFPGSTT